MRYEEFREQLQIALQSVGLFGKRIGNPIETLDLESTVRRWKVYIMGSATANTAPFHVALKIAFNWDPFNTARAYTCEEDLLTELLGRTKNFPKTEPRFIRIDFDLQARLPYGATALPPEGKILGPWAGSIHQKLGKVFSESKWRQGHIVSVLGALEDITIESQCDSAGRLSMVGLGVAGFRMIRLPRIWDSPARRDAENDATAELSQLAKKFEYSLEEWSASIAELALWTDHTLSSPRVEKIDPEFESPGHDKEDDGPETIH